jgi:hypothetical protein
MDDDFEFIDDRYEDEDFFNNENELENEFENKDDERSIDNLSDDNFVREEDKFDLAYNDNVRLYENKIINISEKLDIPYYNSFQKKRLVSNIYKTYLTVVEKYKLENNFIDSFYSFIYKIPLLQYKNMTMLLLSFYIVEKVDTSRYIINVDRFNMYQSSGIMRYCRLWLQILNRN